MSSSLSLSSVFENLFLLRRKIVSQSIHDDSEYDGQDVELVYNSDGSLTGRLYEGDRQNA